MTTHYDDAVSHLDSIVVFMALRRREVFAQLAGAWDEWVDDASTTKPDSAERFEQIILHSALLLGTSYFEAYLADILRACFRAQPKTLSTRNKTLSWESVACAASYEAILDEMIRRELEEFTRLPVEKMIAYFSKHLGLPGPYGSNVETLKEASLARNLIVHNRAIASAELHRLNNRLAEGSPIELEASDVHRYGLAARSVMYQLDCEMRSKYGL